MNGIFILDIRGKKIVCHQPKNDDAAVAKFSVKHAVSFWRGQLFTVSVFIGQLQIINVDFLELILLN